MKCERVGELLPDYLAGQLNHEMDDQVEQHLETCSACREEVSLWRDLAALPQEEPSPSSRVRFRSMLDAYRAGQGEKSPGVFGLRVTPGWRPANWFPLATGGLAFGLVLLAAGFFAGSYVNGHKTPPPQEANAAAVQEMQKEVTDMRQLMVLSMLQQQSAGERLQGVNYSLQQTHADPQVLNALLHTLRYDSSVDVRLAALDALSRHANQPQVHAGILDGLETQQSPLVQVALIDQLVEMRDKSAVGPLQRVKADQQMDPEVRQHAEWALSKLY